MMLPTVYDMVTSTEAAPHFDSTYIPDLKKRTLLGCVGYCVDDEDSTLLIYIRKHSSYVGVAFLDPLSRHLWS